MCGGRGVAPQICILKNQLRSYFVQDMKAVLSNRIFMEASPEYRKILSDELTYKIPAQNPNDPPQIIKNLQRVRENLVSIPIGRTDLIPNDYEIVEKRLYAPATFLILSSIYVKVSRTYMMPSMITVSSMRG